MSSGENLIAELNEFLGFLRRCALVLGVFFVVMLIPVVDNQPISFAILLNILPPSNFSLILGSPVGGVMAILASAFFFAILFSSPLLLILFFKYLKPALYPNERKTAVKITLATTCLFYSGILYGFFIIAPISINILSALGSENIRPIISVDSYVEFVVFSVLSTAVGFLVPIGIYVLSALFNVKINLMKHIRYIFVGSYAIVALLTPDPTPITALLIISPPIILALITQKIIEGRSQRRRHQQNSLP